MALPPPQLLESLNEAVVPVSFRTNQPLFDVFHLLTKPASPVSVVLNQNAIENESDA